MQFLNCLVKGAIQVYGGDPNLGSCPSDMPAKMSEVCPPHTVWNGEFMYPEKGVAFVYTLGTLQLPERCTTGAVYFCEAYQGCLTPSCGTGPSDYHPLLSVALVQCRSVATVLERLPPYVWVGGRGMTAYEAHNYWCVHYGDCSLLSRWITGLTRQQLPPNTQPPQCYIKGH